MTPEQWQNVKEVLGEALELKQEDRQKFLDRVCSSDSSLRREVDHDSLFVCCGVACGARGVQSGHTRSYCSWPDRVRTLRRVIREERAHRKLDVGAQALVLQLD